MEPGEGLEFFKQLVDEAAEKMRASNEEAFKQATDRILDRFTEHATKLVTENKENMQRASKVLQEALAVEISALQQAMFATVAAVVKLPGVEREKFGRDFTDALRAIDVDPEAAQGVMRSMITVATGQKAKPAN